MIYSISNNCICTLILLIISVGVKVVFFFNPEINK